VGEEGEGEGERVIIIDKEATAADTPLDVASRFAYLAIKLSD